MAETPRGLMRASTAASQTHRGRGRGSTTAAAVVAAAATLALLLSLLSGRPPRAAEEPTLRSAAAAAGAAAAAAAAGGQLECARTADAAAALLAGEWQRLPEDKCNGSDPLIASCTSKLGYARVWLRQTCGAHEYGTPQLRQLLKDKHVSILGDSHGRHLFTWLVRMLDGTFDANIDRPLKFWQSARWDGQSGSGAYVKEHGGGDLHVVLSWLTTLPPVAQQVRKLRETRAFPDIVVLSAGEWYHQEKRSVQQLHADVEDLSAAVIEADAAAREAGKQVLWLLLTIPDRVPGRSYSSTFLTPPELVPRYNAALRAASMLHPRGPALLLDLHALAESCLLWCSYDGIHANAAVYAATVQLIANLLALPPAPPPSRR